MLRLILAALFASFCCSCEVDYDLYGKNGKPQVVVNALITPQEPFSVQLNRSGTYTGGNKFAPISGADVQLYENGKQVAQVRAMLRVSLPRPSSLRQAAATGWISASPTMGS